MIFEKKIYINEKLKKFNSIFEKAGFKAYLVGGAVRENAGVRGFAHPVGSDLDTVVIRKEFGQRRQIDRVVDNVGQLVVHIAVIGRPRAQKRQLVGGIIGGRRGQNRHRGFFVKGVFHRRNVECQHLVAVLFQLVGKLYKGFLVRHKS